MAVHLPPVVKTSKKTIPGRRVFDAAKVFADYDINTDATRDAFDSHYKGTFNGSSTESRREKLHPAGKINKPDPTSVHFLFENPRFINEPICNASTKITKHEQHKWWPNEIPKEVTLQPPYSGASSQRKDFGNISNRPEGLTRFSCVEGKRWAAKGIVPVTELPACHTKTERISYIHQFDSRGETKERGKLHGSFVWDTSQNSTNIPIHRFVKRHFECPDTINLTETSFDEFDSSKPNGCPVHKLKGKRNNVREGEKRGSLNNAKSEKHGLDGNDTLQRSTLMPPRDERVLIEQKPIDATDPTRVARSAMSAGKKQHNKVKYQTSPPPHLC